LPRARGAICRYLVLARHAHPGDARCVARSEPAPLVTRPQEITNPL
jgi:hypothetical protein